MFPAQTRGTRHSAEVLPVHREDHRILRRLQDKYHSIPSDLPAYNLRVLLLQDYLQALPYRPHEYQKHF